VRCGDPSVCLLSCHRIERAFGSPYGGVEHGALDLWATHDRVLVPASPLRGLGGGGCGELLLIEDIKTFGRSLPFVVSSSSSRHILNPAAA
jgi:hypothetical protein